MEKMGGVWTVMMMLISMLAILHSATCTDSLATDGCIVYLDFTFETVEDSVNLHVGHLDNNRHPTARVKYNGGNEDVVFLNSLSYGKWTEGVLKLGAKSEFVPTDGTPTTSTTTPSTTTPSATNETVDAQDTSIRRSEVTLKDGLFYRNCPKETPNFVLGYSTNYQLPRTGKAREEVLLLPPLTSNVSLVVGGVDLVICKVEGKTVVKKVTEAQCTPLSTDEEVKLTLGFPEDKKIELAVSDQDPITVDLTEDTESVKFKQPARNERTLYVQCPDTCPSPADGPRGESCGTGYTVVSVFLAIFVILTIALFILVLVLLYKSVGVPK